MDKLDQWMNKALNEDGDKSQKPSEKKFQHNSQQKKKADFAKRDNRNTHGARFHRKNPGARATGQNPVANPANSGANGTAPQRPHGAKPTSKPHKRSNEGQQSTNPHAKRSNEGQQSTNPHAKRSNEGQQSAKPHKRSNEGQQSTKPHKRSNKGQQQKSQVPVSSKVKKPVSKLPKSPKGKPTQILKGKLKIIPLGGLNEVGKNMMAFEYEQDIIIVDMGLEFPSDDLLGIDYVIPDVSYLEENKNRIRAVVLTHGHLDHIGGIPYILPKLGFPPVYGTRLTLGLVEKRLEEFKLTKMASLRTFKDEESIKFGTFKVTPFSVAHSIPDAVGLDIDTPIGKIIHTGDFKFDEEPVGGQKKTNVPYLQKLGSQNVLALFSDSTNSVKDGHTMSETEVGRTLEKLIRGTESRLIIASFSSLIGRLQQIVNFARTNNRKVFVSGRSLQNNMEIASKLGYMKAPPNFIQDIKKYNKKMPDNEVLILTTGSQGETVSALARIANKDHPHIQIKKNDRIILSSSPIIGNEKAIFSVVNNLCKQGAEVIHNKISDVHTSGHGYRDELKQMIDLVKPKFFLPVHGEYFMRQAHAMLAKDECGIPEENIIMLQNGDVLLGERGRVYKSVETVETKYILIDGRGEGQQDSMVLRDREIMSQNGALTVLVHINKKTKKLTKTPDIISRGFVYMHETKEITEEIAEIAGEAYRRIHQKHPGADRKDIKKYIKQTVDKYTNNKLERRPLLVPLIIES